MSRIALIRARNGSSGLPGKNMRQLGGKPLLWYSIDVAKRSGVFDSIAVSSNWDEALALAEREGVVAVRRPESLSSGFASLEAVLDHSLLWMEAKANRPSSAWKTIAILNPTSPFRSTADIADCVHLLEAGARKYTNTMTVAESHLIPMRNTLHGPRNTSGVFRLAERIASIHRQQRRPALVQTGSVYCIDADWYRQSKRWLGPRVGVVVTPKERSLDIDDIWDFMAAEAWMGELNKLACTV